jgi:hypothetical protein
LRGARVIAAQNALARGTEAPGTEATGYCGATRKETRGELVSGGKEIPRPPRRPDSNLAYRWFQGWRLTKKEVVDVKSLDRDKRSIKRNGAFWVHRDEEEVGTLKNEEKILAALASGGATYATLQERSGVPEGSFGRVLGRLVEWGTVTKNDGYYHLPGDSDSSDGDSNYDLRDGGSNSGDGAFTSEDPRRPIITIPKRKTDSGTGLVATITDADSSTRTVSWEEHRRAKGYLD